MTKKKKTETLEEIPELVVEPVAEPVEKPAKKPWIKPEKAKYYEQLFRGGK